MCLLITQTKETNFTEEHLRDFYTRNRDGIGVMWAENGALHYHKIVPTSAQESIDFYNKYARGKECAVHYRMRTHGDVDLENCHPYEVFGFDGKDHEMPMLLMHNGVLHTGNHADTSKSDTWHYIRDYLHKLLANDPSLAFTPEFKDVIGKHIGNNRFVLMNHEGKIATINRHQGVTFNNAWLSNTYAWSYDRFVPQARVSYYPGTTGGKVGSWGTWNHQTQRYEAPALPKSPATKARGRPKNKKGSQPTTNSGGKTISNQKITENEQNGVSTDCVWLDDILEMRSILDAYYIDNSTTNKQFECMIEEMGVSRAYLALEVLGDGLISNKAWDTLSTSRAEMKLFASMPVTEWYPDTQKKLALM